MDAMDRRAQSNRIVGWIGLGLAVFILFAAIRMAPYSIAWCGFLILGALLTAYASLRQLGIVRRR
ncbi:hypothetical protein [Flexivirga oryzae]|uniref:Uncharacterized protein n=1 Tax=Flexivirga oryzae TaxID=1794944 RepID=A0A839N735_9MICO|nr:hypothetical protein [Flexivirga oryzae]MBB2891923.1 hypothetical protein [Flexivirga oryzae]